MTHNVQQRTQMGRMPMGLEAPNAQDGFMEGERPREPGTRESASRRCSVFIS
jgi:hypothetical protein